MGFNIIKGLLDIKKIEKPGFSRCLYPKPLKVLLLQEQFMWNIPSTPLKGSVATVHGMFFTRVK